MAGSMEGLTSGSARAYGDGTTEHSETAVLEADIRETQERLGDTVEEIGERFNPRRLKEEVKNDIRDATIGRMENMAQQTADMMSGAQRNVMASIRENPIPFAMVGIGLGWLLLNGKQRREADGSYRNGSNGDSNGRGTLDRAKEKAGTIVDSLKDRGSMIADRAQETVGRVQEGAVDVAGLVSEETRIQSRHVGKLFQENPLLMGTALFALGLAGGLAIPATQKEAELVGEARDNLVDKVRGVADDTKSKVEEVAGRVLHDAQAAASDAAHAVGLMS